MIRGGRGGGKLSSTRISARSLKWEGCGQWAEKQVTMGSNVREAVLNIIQAKASLGSMCLKLGKGTLDNR